MGLSGHDPELSESKSDLHPLQHSPLYFADQEGFEPSHQIRHQIQSLARLSNSDTGQYFKIKKPNRF